MARVAMVVILLAPAVLTGCLGPSEPVAQGPWCPLFDPAAPAGTARLSHAPGVTPPPNQTFVLTIAWEDDPEPFQRSRFHEDGCVGFSLPDRGTFRFTATAEDPDDGDCRWTDTVARTLGPDAGGLDVTLSPARACA